MIARGARWRTGGVGWFGVALAMLLATGCGQPDREEVRTQVRAALAEGKAADADRLLATLGDSNPLESSDRLMIAEVKAALGQPEKALESLSEVPSTDRLGPTARVVEGRLLLWSLHQARRGEETLLKALATPGVVEADVRRDLAALYDIQARFPERDRELEALDRLGPLSLEDLAGWSRVRRPVGELAEVATLLERFVKADPEDEVSKLALAEVRRKQGRVDEAEAIVGSLTDQVETSKTKQPRLLALCAELALDVGNAPKAMECLAEGPPGAPALERLRGGLALARGDGAAAMEHYEKAKEGEGEAVHRDTIFGLGQAYRLLGRADEARPWLDRAARLDRVELLAQRIELPKNREDAERAIELGQACAEAERASLARAWYRRALALDPTRRDIQRLMFELDERASKRGTPTSPASAAAEPTNRPAAPGG